MGTRVPEVICLFAIRNNRERPSILVVAHLRRIPVATDDFWNDIQSPLWRCTSINTREEPTTSLRFECPHETQKFLGSKSRLQEMRLSAAREHAVWATPFQKKIRRHRHK